MSKSTASISHYAGSLRIDRFHRGDEDGVRGSTHQRRGLRDLATCERLSEAYPVPVIEAMLEGFPFTISGFHADNGSEHINHQVAGRLEKLRIEARQVSPAPFERQRPGGDQERRRWCASASATAIPQRYAMQINAFCATCSNPYLHFHRPFAEDAIDPTGK